MATSDTTERDSAVKIQSLYRGKKARDDVKELKVDLQKKSDLIASMSPDDQQKIVQIQSMQRGKVARKRVSELQAGKEQSVKRESVEEIQATFRGHQARRETEAMKETREPDLPLQHAADSAVVKDFVAQKGTRPRWYTTEDIADHSDKNSAWVSIFGRVLDLTSMIAEWSEQYPELVAPLEKFAGSDISHWFDEDKRSVRQMIDKEGLARPYLPHGPFVHAYPAEPDIKYPTSFEGESWWNDWKYVIGLRSTESRPLVFVNTVSEERNRITAAGEETLNEILDHRVLAFNKHARSYTWKWIGQQGRPLVMTKTLAENLVENLQPEFTDLCLQEETAVPVIMLHYNDDLTVA